MRLRPRPRLCIGGYPLGFFAPAAAADGLGGTPLGFFRARALVRWVRGVPPWVFSGACACVRVRRCARHIPERSRTSGSGRKSPIAVPGRPWDAPGCSGTFRHRRLFFKKISKNIFCSSTHSAHIGINIIMVMYSYYLGAGASRLQAQARAGAQAVSNCPLGQLKQVTAWPAANG